MPLKTLLELSTAHITRADNDLLTEAVDATGDDLVVYPTDTGFLLMVPPSNEDWFDWDGLSHIGYSAALIKILRVARDLNCDFVLFDGSGDKHTTFPTFSWDTP